MPLIFDHAAQPPGGYRFADPSGCEIRSAKLRDLLKSIAVYRQNNGLPPGNPEQEVEAVYRTEYPWLVSKVGLTVTAAPDPLDRWIADAWKRPPKLFDSEVVIDRRRGACAVCPHWEPEASLTTDQLRRATLLGASSYRDHGRCRVHNWPCGLAVLIERPVVKESVPDCWAQIIP